jgi:predicted molibdopterin-dependent oxidoreductase YjgC
VFRYLEGKQRLRESIMITIDGVALEVPAQETLAAAMLQSGRLDLRTTAISGAARSAYCMMGVCFDCLVTIDDQPNQQACMTVVRPGMRVERQVGAGQIVRVPRAGDAS